MPPAELATPERPDHVALKPSGEMVTVDKGMLSQLTDGYVGALGMVARLNLRIAGFSAWAACQKASLATGQSPPGC